MMIDFSSYIDERLPQQQSTVQYLPSEAVGSNLWITIQLDPAPKFPDARCPTLSVAKSGMVQIPLILTVSGGKFAGRRFFSSLFAPVPFQHINMSSGQQKACDIASRLMRKLLLSAACMSSRDTSAEAKNAASLNTWHELNGKCSLVKIGEFNGHPCIDDAICAEHPDYAKGEQLSASAQAWTPNAPKPQPSQVLQAITDNFGPFPVSDDDCPF